MDEKDTWRTASVMIRQHGDQAELQAALKADEMLNRGDLEGQAVWKRVLGAIRELGSTEGDARH